MDISMLVLIYRFHSGHPFYLFYVGDISIIWERFSNDKIVKYPSYLVYLFIFYRDNSLIHWEPYLYKDGNIFLSPKLWHITLVLLFYRCQLGSNSCNCTSLFPIYISRIPFHLNNLVLWIDVIYKEVSPWKWLIIWFSFIFKVWITYSYVFVPSGYLVYNVCY